MYKFHVTHEGERILESEDFFESGQAEALLDCLDAVSDGEFLVELDDGLHVLAAKRTGRRDLELLTGLDLGPGAIKRLHRLLKTLRGQFGHAFEEAVRKGKEVERDGE